MTMKLLPSAPSGARLAVMAALAALLARPAVGQATTPTFVQGTAFSTGDRVLTTTVTLTSPVAGGDLLVGWFSQYNDPGQVQVSGDVNGLLTSPAPGSVTPGSSMGVPYTARAQTSNGSAFEEDITSSAAGAQQGTAALGAATDWYAVCAVFHSDPPTPPVPPSTPTGLAATSVASTRVALSWSPSSGSVAGYTVYRDGSAIG